MTERTTEPDAEADSAYSALFPRDMNALGFARRAARRLASLSPRDLVTISLFFLVTSIALVAFDLAGVAQSIWAIPIVLQYEHVTAMRNGIILGLCVRGPALFFFYCAATHTLTRQYASGSRGGTRLLMGVVTSLAAMLVPLLGYAYFIIPGPFLASACALGPAIASRTGTTPWRALRTSARAMALDRRAYLTFRGACLGAHWLTNGVASQLSRYLSETAGEVAASAAGYGLFLLHILVVTTADVEIDAAHHVPKAVDDHIARVFE